jgi:hypothetical protein
MSFVAGSNHLGPHHQTTPQHNARRGERVGHPGLFGTFQTPARGSDLTWADTRGMIIQTAQRWGCQPTEGWLPERNFRDTNASSAVGGFITGRGHAQTEITFPVARLGEHEGSWVVKVDAKLCACLR